MPANTEFKRPDGNTAPAYYAEPQAGAQAPGIVVIQEWWGINDQIERVANRLAEAGYRALVPDLYRGDKALDAAEAEHKMNNLDFGDAAKDVQGACQYLKQSSDKVGVIGFCMGGVLAMVAAMNFPEPDAISAWYGLPPDEAGDPVDIKVPLQGHFALQDQMFTADAVDAFEDKVKKAGVDYVFYRYDADHAFGNEDWDNYDADAAAQAWQRSLDFFANHLK